MNQFKQLYIFVEGPDDERFINSVIKPNCTAKYSYVKIVRYASRVPSDINKLISTIRSQPSSDYIFMSDMDARGDITLCITSKKSKISSKFSNVLETEKILIVKEEIESWYLAGIPPSNLTKYKIKTYNDTEQVTKEEFHKLIPKKFDSVSDFMVEILKDFSLEHARTLNKSFDYFIHKHIL